MKTLISHSQWKNIHNKCESSCIVYSSQLFFLNICFTFPYYGKIILVSFFFSTETHASLQYYARRRHQHLYLSMTHYKLTFSLIIWVHFNCLDCKAPRWAPASGCFFFLEGIRKNSSIISECSWRKYSLTDIYTAVSVRISSASTLQNRDLTFGREIALMAKCLFYRSENPHKFD